MLTPFWSEVTLVQNISLISVFHVCQNHLENLLEQMLLGPPPSPPPGIRIHNLFPGDAEISGLSTTL